MKTELDQYIHNATQLIRLRLQSVVYFSSLCVARAHTHNTTEAFRITLYTGALVRQNRKHKEPGKTRQGMSGSRVRSLREAVPFACLRQAFVHCTQSDTHNHGCRERVTQLVLMQPTDRPTTKPTATQRLHYAACCSSDILHNDLSASLSQYSCSLLTAAAVLWLAIQ